jgi:Fe-S cluster assembly protein NifU
MSDGVEWAYTEVVKDHFFNPRNIMTQSEEEFAADGVGEVGSISCGDLMKLWIKVDRENDTISDCKWKTFGCASAIGSTSMLSTMVIGMKVDEALKLTPEDIMEKLGGLPARKVHCSVLGDKALRSAVEDYFRRTNQTTRLSGQESAKIVCECLTVTREEIEEAVLHGATTVEAVQERTKAGTNCGNCLPEITELVKELTARFQGN